MLELQNEINEAYTKSQESVLKKLYAQPLNGNSTINIASSGGTQVRIEIPACLNKIDEMELSYTLTATINNVPINSGATKDAVPMIYGMDARCETLFQRIECYMANSTNKFVDLSNAAYYHKEVSSLKNDFMKRNISQRFNFPENLELFVPASVSIVNSVDFDKNGYFNAAGGGVAGGASLLTTPVAYAQQQYIPLNKAYAWTTTPGAPNGNVTYTGATYQFTYKLRDLLPDSIFAKYKYLPHKSNLVLIFWLNPVTQIATCLYNGQMVIAAGNAPTNTLTADTVTYSRPIESTAISLTMSNVFVKYWAETNPGLVKTLMESEFVWCYPFLYQANISSTSTQNGCNLIIGNEGDNRLYRIYTSLFASGTYASGRDTLYNNTNLSYEKWDTNVELYINNDLIARIVPGTSAGLYDDWKDYFDRYCDSSLNSGREIENHGVVVYDLDCNIKNGSKLEYDDNNLRGMLLDQQVNINPRFLNVKQADGIATYNQYIFAVVFRQCVIKGGEMLLI